MKSVFSSGSVDPSPDIFSLAKERYTIPEIWKALGFEGSPKTSCKSPFREDKNASFSIFEDGRKWKDHATEQGGDVVEFVKLALGVDYPDVRKWFSERLGVEIGTSGNFSSTSSTSSIDCTSKKIQWPSKLVTGTEATWEAFAKMRGYSYGAVWTMSHLGVLRFTEINGEKCLVVLDDEGRAAEIRALNRTSFYGKNKAYPLKGVDKTWLVGTAALREAPSNTSLLICEGATDFLSAIDLLYRYRRELGGIRSWMPVALLGATCKKLAPDCASLMRGRKVRIVPDADRAGEMMASHWAALCSRIECEVDVVRLEPGQDLTDILSSVNPRTLFA